MAETVVSMARSLVGGAIGAAATAAGNEMSMLIGVQSEIWYIKDELETMQAFLRAAEVTKERDELVKVWAKQVRDLAYDIEDCLQEFAVHVGSQSLARQLMKLRHRHRVAVQIRSLKLRVEEVSNRNMRYNLIKSVPSSSTDDSIGNFELTRYQAAHYVDEAELIGFDGPKKDILDMISNNGSTEARTICIVGAGGLGKTTLAKKVYESSEISGKFTCRAWITVSQSFDTKELLKAMIKQLLGEQSLNKFLEQHKGVMVHAHNLTNHLKTELSGKRYFLVLDDLWRKEDWDCIKPTNWGNNKEGSLVVVTTRNSDAVEGSGSRIYHLKILNNEDATKLLLKKTKRSLDDIEKDQVKKTFENILKKCGGLPLAIVTIGALLAEKDVKDWETLYAQLPSELEINPSLEAMRKVVSLSYNYLPSHLKPCFLYLSIFPEDFEIKRSRLVHRWIAEGFVRARHGVSITDIANKYFDELIGRSMIQPSRVNIEGTIQSCRVHDIMRDIMISISRGENFVYLIAGNEATVAEGSVRHAAYHDNNNPKIVIDWNHVRSLTIFGQRPKELVPSLCSPGLRMLRVLDLQNVNFGLSQKDMNNIGLLCHLKYMNISCGRGYSHIYALPRSIGKLQGLQTLDITYTYIGTLPTEIIKLQSLRILSCGRQGRFEFLDRDNPSRCLLTLCCMPAVMVAGDSDYRRQIIAELHMGYFSLWSKQNGVKVPRGINNLKELQKLGVVDIKRTSSKAVKQLGELSHLRKLSVITNGATEKKCKILYASIEKLSSLQSLYMDNAGYCLDSISRLPPNLSSLILSGPIEVMPDWFRELSHLVKILLSWSEMRERKSKTMEILGGLPNLMLLQLYSNAYAGKLVFRAGAFPNLRKLDIRYADKLSEMRFEEGTSPLMETIEITLCRLESGIIGIKHLPRLKEISLQYDCQVARLDQLQEEVDAHPNRPVLRMEKVRKFHDLGDIGGSTVQVEATEESLPRPAGESSQVIMLTANDSSEVAHLSSSRSRDQEGSPSEGEAPARSTSPSPRIEELELDILKTSTDDATSPVGVQIAEDLHAAAGSQSAN